MEPASPYPPLDGAPDAPRRLPPPPRALRRRPGRRGLLRHVPLWLWLLCLAGFGLLVLSVWLVGRPWVITQFGVPVTGEVTDKVPPAERSREGVVRFAYHLGEGKYTAEEVVTEADFDRLKFGSPVKVRVLGAWPGAPVLIEPPGRSSRGNGVLLSFALLGNVGLVVLVRRYLREPRRQAALVREGVATEGAIVSREVRGGRRPSWSVQYRYRAPRYGVTDPDLEGPPVAEKEWQVRMAVRQEDYEFALEGAAVTVLYDPRRPARSLVYRFAIYEAVPPSREMPSD